MDCVEKVAKQENITVRQVILRAIECEPIKNKDQMTDFHYKSWVEKGYVAQFIREYCHKVTKKQKRSA